MIQQLEDKEVFVLYNKEIKQYKAWLKPLPTDFNLNKELEWKN